MLKMKTSCALILLLAVLSSVQSRTLQQGCPISADEISSLDLGNVNEACGKSNGPQSSEDKCFFKFLAQAPNLV